MKTVFKVVFLTIVLLFGGSAITQAKKFNSVEKTTKIEKVVQQFSKYEIGILSLNYDGYFQRMDVLIRKSPAGLCWGLSVPDFNQYY